jgi:hypothetical protein
MESVISWLLIGGSLVLALGLLIETFLPGPASRLDTIELAIEEKDWKRRGELERQTTLLEQARRKAQHDIDKRVRRVRVLSLLVAIPSTLPESKCP